VTWLAMSSGAVRQDMGRPDLARVVGGGGRSPGAALVARMTATMACIGCARKTRRASGVKTGEALTPRLDRYHHTKA